LEQAENAFGGQEPPAIESVQFDDEGTPNHIGSTVFDETAARGHRPSRSQKVVDEQHPLSRFEAVLMDFE
jgi:hypothetical protein